MEKKIKQIFTELGIEKQRKGYYLWQQMIQEFCKKNKDTIRDLPKIKITSYYSSLAKTNNTTYVAVERNLRSCIESKMNLIKEYFNYNGKISNKVFLILMIEKINELEGK